jgi:hypothetical protein
MHLRQMLELWIVNVNVSFSYMRQGLMCLCQIFNTPLFCLTPSLHKNHRLFELWIKNKHLLFTMNIPSHLNSLCLSNNAFAYLYPYNYFELFVPLNKKTWSLCTYLWNILYVHTPSITSHTNYEHLDKAGK